LEEEEKESIGEVVEHADEGELLVVRRDLISFQTNEKPKDDAVTPNMRKSSSLLLTPSLNFLRRTHKRALDN